MQTQNKDCGLPPLSTVPETQNDIIQNKTQERAGEHYTDLSVVLRPIWSPLVNKIQWNEGQFYWEVGG